ncbi:alpha/beta hydrolase-fold protein [Brevibacillus sp. B_LB10_24]|uniref:alpha/beta hydrolase-fold protein n=1 Tax=Brevibacillus sp. B_LB10_24 TaxID=3380645 RepID=UPI0038BDFA18
MDTIQRFTVYGRQVVVYVPPSYSATEDRYPVAYVQDGGYLFTHCVNLLAHLVSQGKLAELILIGIKPHQRNDEYTPWMADALREGNSSFGGKGRTYVDEVADVLKPYIDERFRTKRDASHTAMIGGSLGGLISLFAGYWRPDTFGRIGLLSASLWNEGVMEYIMEQGPPAKHLRVFMSVGSCEGIHKQNMQKEMVHYNKQVRSLWLEQGFPGEQLRFVLEEGGTHDAYYMIKQFPAALQWLFPPEREPASAVAPVWPATAKYAIPGTRQFAMRAKNTGREYRIFVSVPDTPAPPEGYPILYVLDGNASFGSLTEAMRLQARGPHGIEQAVIVATVTIPRNRL